jgi:hypothetical protein
MTLAYRKGALNEADLLSRRPDFVPHAIVRLFWDGEVPLDTHLRRKSQPLLNNAQLNLLTANALRLSREFADLIREGHFMRIYCPTVHALALPHILIVPLANARPCGSAHGVDTAATSTSPPSTRTLGSLPAAPRHHRYYPRRSGCPHCLRQSLHPRLTTHPSHSRHTSLASLDSDYRTLIYQTR